MTKSRPGVDFLSVRISRRLMKIAGFWAAENQKEETMLKALLTYTIIMLAAALWIEVSDFYMSVGDFYAVTYTACSCMPVVLVLVKVFNCLRHWDKLMEIIRYTQDNFWNGEDDDFGREVMQDFNRKGAVLISYFTFFVQGTCITYALVPLIENVGKNESNRILPFHMWLFNKDVKVSPYFEVIFTIQIFALIHAGLCFCCFDNFLCLLNLNTAAQFRILQRRIETIYDRHYLALRKSSDEQSRLKSVYRELEDCVVTHQNLLYYMEMLESVFAYAILCQLVVSSVMLCVTGFQVFHSRGTLMRRIIFISHTNGSFFQLFVITFSSDEVMEQSVAVSRAAYMTGWQYSSFEKHGKIRHNLRMIMRRAEQPCCLSAGHFFPVTLETFKSVLSAAASYFTLLRKFVNEEDVL